MPDDSALLGELVEEYTARLRQGERPNIEEYAARHARLAERIRHLFPTLLLLEGLANPSQASGGRQTPEHLPPGTLFGAYRIVRELGRGGMGIVYEAEHQTLHRRVALKILPVAGPHAAKHLERFFREAKTAAGLHHTNIVPVFDVGQSNGIPFYAMQYIPGRSLDRIIKGEPVSSPGPSTPLGETGSYHPEAASVGWATPTAPAATETNAGHNPPHTPTADHYRFVAELGIQAAAGLAYAHQRGVIHRDIKPSNLLLDEQGTVWITDFGLARRLDDVTLTQPGQLLGTPRYMSPEQAEAAQKPLDHRTDLYSLGATLYELLVRRPAFDGQTPQEVVTQIITRDPILPRKLDPKVPRDLETIIVKAMAKRPEDRYPTAADLGEDLRRFLANEPIRARRISFVGRTWRWCKRNPTLAGMTLAIILITLISFLAVAHQWQQAVVAGNAETVAKQDALTQRNRANEEKEAAQRARNESDKARKVIGGHLYGAEVFRVQHEWEEGNITAVEDWLKAQIPKPGEEDRRGFEWYYYWNLCYGGRRILAGHADDISDLAFSYDGKTFVSVGVDGAVIVWDVVSGEERASSQGVNSSTRVAFSPDGKFFGCGCVDHSVRIWETTTGKQAHLLKGHQARVRRVIFAPDGRSLVSSSTDKTITVWDLQTGAALRTLVGHQEEVIGLAFSPDGRTLASSSADKTVRLWDPSTGALLATLKGHKAPAWGICYLPDGQGLVSSSNDDGVVLVWDIKTASIRQSIQAHQEGVSFIALTRDGKTLATCSKHGKIGLWDITTGQARRQLKRSKDPYSDNTYRVTFSPDDRYLVLSGGSYVRFWDLSEDEERSKWLVPNSFAHCAAFSPDGSLVAFQAEHGPIALWNTEAATRAWNWKGHTAGVNSVAVSPNRTLFATASADKTIRLWNRPAGKTLHVLTGHTDSVTSLCFAPDGVKLASLSIDKTVRLWDTVSGACITTFQFGDKAPDQLLFSPDGKTLAVTFAGIFSSGKAINWGVWLWDISAGRERPVPKGPLRNAYLAAFSPDGKFLTATGWDRSVGIWNLATNEYRVLRSPDPRFGVVGAGVTSSPNERLAFSPDGRMLAATDRPDRSVVIWDLASGKEVCRLRFPGYWDMDIVFAPSSALLATNDRNTIQLWNPLTGQELCSFQGHTKGITQVLFSPDGTALASASADGTVKLWDWTLGTERMTFKGGTQAINAIAFTHDGEMLAAAGGDGAVHVWQAPRRPEAVIREVMEQGQEYGLVANLFRQHFTRPGVLQVIDRDVTLTLKQKRRAKNIAQRTGEEIDSLNNRSWRTVVLADQNPEDYQEALRISEAVYRAEPNGLYLNTLGVALFRVGKYAEAYQTLTKTLQMNVNRSRRGHLDDLTTLPLVAARLGHRQAFSEHVAALHERCTSWEPNHDHRRFLRELEIERRGLSAGQAYDVVLELMAEVQDGNELLRRIAAEESLDATSRSLALEIAREYEAIRQARRLRREYPRKAEILAKLRADPNLGQPVRDKVLAIAETIIDDVDEMAAACARLSVDPKRHRADYERALSYAQTALAKFPKVDTFIAALGMAQYRLGQFKEALASFVKLRGEDRSPTTLAFLVMANHQAGQPDKAKEHLQRLREMLKDENRSQDKDAQALRREAEGLILGKKP